jgi:hypothetical protein
MEGENHMVTKTSTETPKALAFGMEGATSMETKASTPALFAIRRHPALFTCLIL